MGTGCKERGQRQSHRPPRAEVTGNTCLRAQLQPLSARTAPPEPRPGPAKAGAWNPSAGVRGVPSPVTNAQGQSPVLSVGEPFWPTKKNLNP